MKLNQEGVGKAALKLMVHMGCEPIEDDWRACIAKHCLCREVATAALTAYFDHLKQEGLMREATGKIRREDDWSATTWKIPDWFPALIIRTEEK